MAIHTPSGYRTTINGCTEIIMKNALPEGIIPASGPIGVPSPITGRGNMRLLDHDMIVRELAHGGLFGGITKKRFLSTSRSIRELEISDYLRRNTVYTPEITAVRIIKSGMFYTIDVITRKVPGSIDLLTWLERYRTDQRGEVLRFAQNNRQDDMFSQIFEETGSLVRRMHDLGVWHADLHLKNILLDEHMNPWILDLDKARRFQLLPALMRRMNLKRFFRSCRKWTGKGIISLLPDYQLNFMKGYENGRTPKLNKQ